MEDKINEREFAFWLLGFVYNKSELQYFEVDIIRHKLNYLLGNQQNDNK